MYEDWTQNYDPNHTSSIAMYRPGRSKGVVKT